MAGKWNYEESCEKAILAGYEEKFDEFAYNNSYFIKDDKIWIHNLESLCEKMGFSTLQEVVDAGYALEDWFRYKDLTIHKMKEYFAEEDMLEIYDAIGGNGLDNVYLSDGMWLTPEGKLVGGGNA
ncbi:MULTISPECIES: hypothetical protein [Actinobacillus]|uniref:hypothetical protein n=1 Tax=Actinobacillus TaxID=713 RepID=UPI0024184F61|nr:MULTISPECIES: hypothetical protein [Actinobacillus]MDG4953661.1 hypothetical protein [Actinobacillus equuli subsp. equuli]WGE89981.1 hypothetical protein NYR89_03725 [Actinobacillus arthritidis]